MASESSELSNKTVIQLRAILKDMGLNIYGKKVELIQRIINHHRLMTSVEYINKTSDHAKTVSKKDTITRKIDMQQQDCDIIVESVYKASNIKCGHFTTILLYFSDHNETHITPHCPVDKVMTKAIEEWELYKISDTNEISTTCICTQHIYNEYYIRNVHNDNILRVGSECIQKFMNEHTKQQTSALKRQMEYMRMGSGKYRICASCHKFKIKSEEPAWKNTCKKCFKNGSVSTTIIYADGRQCAGCKRLTIPSNSPKWKTICTDCFKNKDNVQQRMCIGCNKNNIPIYEPSWKTKCVTCFSNT